MPSTTLFERSRGAVSSCRNGRRPTATFRPYLLLCAALAGAILPSGALKAAGIPVPAGTWTLVLTKGLPEETNGWEQLIYIPAIKQSVMFSQYHQRNSEPNESMVGYSFDTNSWDVLDMGGNFHTEAVPEGGESQGYFGFNPSNNTIVYHCCTSGSNQVEDIDHDWWYDVLGQSGRDKHTSPKPPDSALQPGGAFDVAHNVFVMEGGDSFIGTWIYDPVANRWQQKTPGGTPPDPSLILPGVAYSTQAQKVFLFGGQDGGTYNSDIYSYDVPTNTWTLIAPAGGVKPPGRTQHAFAYDSTNNIFLLYGGENASGILNDTWVYDPAANTWTQLHPPQAPPVPSSAIFARLSYDPDHNVFVLAQLGNNGYFGGSWPAYQVQTWLFRYAGSGPNAGTLSTTAAPAAGSLNANTESWGKDPTLASSGGNLYVGWSETSAPFDASDAAWPHIYVSQYSGGGWVRLGSSFQSISIDIMEAHAPSLAVIGGTPWVSFYQSANTGQTARVYASNWTGGSAWQGGAVGFNGGGTPLLQGQSQITGVGTVPHVAMLEVDRTVYPQRTVAYVRSWNGSAWSLKGAALNHSLGAGDTALSVSIASDGTNPYVTWSEYVHSQGVPYDTDTPPQIYVSQWTGSQWSPLGASLNVNAADWAYDPSIAYLNGQVYVAWVERTQTGNNQLYVATWNGAAWTPVGSGSLNQAPGAGWAYHPSLIADAASNSLYLGWVEQTALGQKARVFVSQYKAGAWTNLGGSLNADPVQGSAQRVSIGVYNGQPVAAWGEVNLGAVRQIYVKQWNGSGWTQLSGVGGPPDITAPSTPTSLSANALSSNQIQLSWVPSTDTVGVAGYYIYRNGSQAANVTQMANAVSPFIYADSGVSPSTSYSYTIAAYDAAGNISAPSNAAGATTPAAPPALSAITLSPTSITGGSSTTANTVTLTSAAPAGSGIVVSLTSNNLSAVVPASVTVPAGSTTSPAFTIMTTAVATATPVTISAKYNGVTVNSTLTVNPAATQPGTLLLIRADSSEVSGTSNGSTVTPATGPSGFTGTVAVNGTGSVNFAPGAVGNGVYFLTCCGNANNAHYRFTGAQLGNIFNVNQGQISFDLVSRYTFAQRKASASGQRYAFDVRDGNGAHLFSFLTEVSSGYLMFSYLGGGVGTYYIVPQGTEDALFGNGVTLKVAISWGSGVSNLYLNGALVKSLAYKAPTAAWTAAANFDLGAYEYLSYGAYDVSDDIIDQFAVTGPVTASGPTASMTAPTAGATVSGTTTISANATASAGIASVQFLLDGANLGGPVTGVGPSYTFSWNTSGAANGSHTLAATATDTSGNSATSSSVTVTVSNTVAPPVISGVGAQSITSSGATIVWTTSTAASSQVAYGTTASYGSTSALNTALTTSHSVSLTGLTASTTYHYQALSRDAQGNLASSSDFTFTTAASGSQPALLLHADATEVSGTTNGSTVTPAIAPSGFTGRVVVNSGGSVNFAPGASGNGVYFTSCCGNTNNAYYKFTGAQIGNIFNVTQGQISFDLTSRYTFAQRKASASGQRTAFDVRDGNGNHLFSFTTDVSSGYLMFMYEAGGAGTYYFVPQGTEDALFGSGITLKVTIAWGATGANLYLNGALVKSVPYTAPSASWTAAANFDLGGYEYLTFGGYNSCDDVIDEFTVF